MSDFWEQAGDVLLGGIGKAIDAELTQPQVVNNPTPTQNTRQGDVQAGVPSNAVKTGSVSPYVIAGGVALAALVLFVALRK